MPWLDGSSTPTTLATRDDAGRPRLSPVYYICARYLDLYWVSSPEAQHSRNIVEWSQVEIVIFDSTAPLREGEGSISALSPERLQTNDMSASANVPDVTRRSRCRHRRR